MGSLTTINGAIIDANQHLWTWGLNANDQLGRPPAEGETIDLTPQKVSNDKWKDVSYGDTGVLAIKEDGSLWGWGVNTDGRLGVTGSPSVPTKVNGPASIVKFKKVICSTRCAYAIDDNGRLWHSGSSGYGNFSANGYGSSAEFRIIYSAIKILDITTNYYGIYSEHGGTVSGLFEDGKVFGFGYQYYSGSNQVNYSNGVNNNSNLVELSLSGKFKKISKGFYHTLAIDESNNLWGTGHQPQGQLGRGNTDTASGYVQLPITDVKEVSCGNQHSMIIKNDGTLWGAGYNGYGQLGDGTAVNRSSFIQIGTDLWEKVSCGQHFTIGLKQDGTVWAWGLNTSQQLGVGDNVNKLVPAPVLNLSDNIVTLEGIPLIQKYIVGSKGVFELKSDPIVDLSGFNVRGTFPVGTHTLIQVSDNGSDWKTFESDNWVTVSGLNSGLTVEAFTLLTPDQVKWLDNKEIYLKMIMWTDDENLSPLFESIDARVLMSTESPEVEAASLSYSLSSQEEPKFFLSEDNGTTWNEIEVDEVVQLQEKGKEGILIKAVLKNGQEIDALAYSWK